MGVPCFQRSRAALGVLLAILAGGPGAGRAAAPTEDRTPPVLTVDPAPPLVVGPQTIPISGDLSEEGCRVTVGGSVAQVGGTRFRGVAALSDGTNAVEILATDPAGNVSSVTFSVRRVEPWCELLTVEAGGWPGQGVDLSPDGGFVAYVGHGDVVRVRSLLDGREVLALPHGEAVALAVAFSPDGRLLATGNRDGSVRLWSVPDGQPVRTIPGWTRIRAVSFSRDCLRVVAAAEGVASILSVADGRELSSITITGGTRPEIVAISGEGEWVAVAVDTIQGVRSLRTGAPLGFPGQTAGASVGASSSLPDGSLLLAWADSGSAELPARSQCCVRIHPAAAGGPLRIVPDIGALPCAVAAPADGRVVATGGADGTVRIWDVRTGRQLHSFPGAGGQTDLLRCSASGVTLAAGAFGDRRVVVWAIPDPDFVRSPGDTAPPEIVLDPEPPTFVVHERRIDVSGRVSEDGCTVLVNGLRAVIDGRTFSVEVPLDAGENAIETRAVDPSGNESRVTRRVRWYPPWETVAVLPASGLPVFSRDGRRVALVPRHGQRVRVHSTIGGELEADLPLPTPPTSPGGGETLLTVNGAWSGGRLVWSLPLPEGLVGPYCPAVSEAGHLAAAIARPAGWEWEQPVPGREPSPDILCVWSLPDVAPIVSFPVPPDHGRIVCMQWHPDGRTLVSGSTSGYVRVWSVPEGRETTAFQGFPDGDSIGRLCFSEDGRYLAGCGDVYGYRPDPPARGAWVRALPDATEVAMLRHEGNVTWVALSRDGRYAASKATDGTLCLWALPEGRRTATLRVSSQPVESGLAFAPDGRTVAAAADDETVGVWAVPDGRRVATLASTEGMSGPLLFSPDGRLLSTGGRTATRLWAVPPWTPMTIIPGLPGLGPSCFVSGAPGLILCVAGQTSLLCLSAGDGRSIGSIEGYALSFSDDGRRAVVLAGDRVRVVSIPDGAVLREFQPDPQRQSGAGAPALLPGGDLMVMPGSGIWSVTSGERVAALPGSSEFLGFSADGRCFLSRASATVIDVWSWPGGQRIAGVQLPEMDYRAGTGRVVTSPDSRHAVWLRDGLATSWRLSDGVRVPALDAPDVYSALFSPDGRLLATTGREIRVRSVPDGAEVARLPGVGWVEMAFSPSGRRLATASQQGGIRLWSIPGGREVATLTRFLPYARQPTFSPDGRLLAVRGLGVLTLWSLPDEE